MLLWKSLESQRSQNRGSVVGYTTWEYWTTRHIHRVQTYESENRLLYIYTMVYYYYIDFSQNLTVTTNWRKK